MPLVKVRFQGWPQQQPHVALAIAALAIACILFAARTVSRPKSSISRLPLPPPLPRSESDHGDKPRHISPLFAQPAHDKAGVFRVDDGGSSSRTWLSLLSWLRPPPVVLVLNNAQAATDLLDGRSAIYSDRPVAVTGNQLRSHGLSVPFTPYGDLFRRHRRAFTAAFARAAVPRYDTNVRSDLVLLLDSLAHHATTQQPLHASNDWYDYVYRFVTSQTMHTTYGRCVKDVHTDEFVVAARECNENFFAMNKPGGFLVDRFPLLARLPRCINPWKQMCEPWFAKELQLFLNEMMASTKQTTRKPSLAQNVYTTRAESGLTDEQAAYLCGTMYGASVDTTFQALSVFFLAAANHPEAMGRVKKEIDVFVGKDRLPTHADLDSLPLCSAVVKEVLRWRPFAHGAAPHRVLKDDEYHEMHIPRGATVYGNVWGIHQDPRLYKDPKRFIPERYLDGNTEWINRGALPSRRDLFSFGFGRRICPGEQLAMRTLSLTVACLLWAFDIRAPIDPATGEDIPLDDTAFHTDSLSSTPIPFGVRILPRDADRLRALVDAEA